MQDFLRLQKNLKKTTKISSKSLSVDQNVFSGLLCFCESTKTNKAWVRKFLVEKCLREDKQKSKETNVPTKRENRVVGRL